MQTFLEHMRAGMLIPTVRKLDLLSTRTIVDVPEWL